jgi:hypothetical protein
MPRRLVLTLLLAAPAAVFAQEPPKTASDPKQNQKIERIHVEDSAVKIEELRYAGQVQSITVQPKDGLPAYEIVPPNPARSRIDDRRGTSGDRVWNVFSF